MIEKPKTPTEKLAENNRLAACPMRLFTEDGREIGITRWNPTIAVGECVTVLICGRIMMKDAT